MVTISSNVSYKCTVGSPIILLYGYLFLTLCAIFRTVHLIRGHEEISVDLVLVNHFVDFF